MALPRWYCLGSGPFALEVFDWACDALGGGAQDAFGGFLGDPSGAAPMTLGLPCHDEREMQFAPGDKVVNAIADVGVKAKVCAKMKERGGEFLSVVHPSAVVRAKSLGEGTLICPLSTIGSHTVLADFVTVNYQCGIGHETEIGAFSTLSPGVQIGGRSKIGSKTFIGLSAAILDNTKIGSDVMIAAGSVVIARVRDGRAVSGNPARRMKIAGEDPAP